MVTLRKELTEAALAHGDDPATLDVFYQPCVMEANWRVKFADDPVRVTGTEELPEREYDDGFGAVVGEPFIAFSADWVYVCATYDGSEWVTAVPRNPESVGAYVDRARSDEWWESGSAVLPRIGEGE